jgi:hypothetical protein
MGNDAPAVVPSGPAITHALALMRYRLLSDPSIDLFFKKARMTPEYRQSRFRAPGALGRLDIRRMLERGPAMVPGTSGPRGDVGDVRGRSGT